MEVSGDLFEERCDLGRERGHELLRWQDDRDRPEVLFADFGEGGAGSAALDLSHVGLAPMQHEAVRCRSLHFIAMKP